MPVNFGGKWTLMATNNYEHFLTDMKVPEAVQKELLKKTNLEIVHEGDTIKYRRERGDAIFEIDINIGQEYTELTYGHSEVRICKWEGDKLVIKAVDGKGNWASCIEFVDDQLVATDTSPRGISGKRIFQRVTT
ncbi:retinol-binding protein 1-like [Amphiura filiformis]|uniref:retinol-binding protein 1-like n=1 Tax=Amphiura filiformis TaxID=82378 RepID=UPI003B213CCE